jgi:hypothetical protein
MSNIIRPDQIFLGNQNSTRIAGFLAWQCGSDGAADGIITIHLDHIGPDDTNRVVRTFELESVPESEPFNELVRTIDQTAMDDASQLPGPRHRYMLATVGSRGRELGSLIISYTPMGGAPWSGGVSEEPSDKGLVNQSMRHTEFALMWSFQAIGSHIESLTRRLTQQDVLLERALTRQAALIDEKQELASRQAERELALEDLRRRQDLEALRELGDIDRAASVRKFAMEKVNALVPVLLNRLAGSKIVPDASNPVVEMLGTLSARLRDEDVEALRASLPPELGALLSELISAGRTISKPAPAASPGPAGSDMAAARDVFGPVPPQMIDAALEIVRRDLLAWAAENMAELRQGKKDVTRERPSAVLLLVRVISSLSASQVEALVTSDGRFTAGERETLVQIIKLLGNPTSAVPPAK